MPRCSAASLAFLNLFIRPRAEAGKTKNAALLENECGVVNQK